MVFSWARRWLSSIFQRLADTFPLGSLPSDLLSFATNVGECWRLHGLKAACGLVWRSWWCLWSLRPWRLYRYWSGQPHPTPRAPIEAETPLLSFLTLVTKTDLPQLPKTQVSLLAQTALAWEWLIVPTESSLSCPTEWAIQDSRIRWLDACPDWTTGANQALARAQGNFLALLDAGDQLSLWTVAEVAHALHTQPESDVLYTDEDRISTHQQRSAPIFKPQWSPETLLGYNYLGRLTVLRTALVKQVGGFCPTSREADAWELILRVTEQTSRIHRIAQVLYHRLDTNRPMEATHAPTFVAEHLQRRLNVPVVGDRRNADTLRFIWPITQPALVSIIIPNRNRLDLLERCITGLLHNTEYSQHEVIIVDNQSTDQDVLAYYDRLRDSRQATVLAYTQPFNYSAVCNWGARQARGDLLLFLNNDIEVLEPTWLTEMVRWAQVETIGVVGAKLFYSDGRIQHAGVVCGRHFCGRHIYRGQRETASTLFGTPNQYRNYLAVTGACQMIRHQLFDVLGGYDAGYQLCFSDVVLCLEAWRRGWRTLYTPHARLRHHESSTRQSNDPREQADFDRCARFLATLPFQTDPYFHPALFVMGGPHLQLFDVPS